MHCKPRCRCDARRRFPPLPRWFALDRWRAASQHGAMGALDVTLNVCPTYDSDGKGLGWAPAAMRLQQCRLPSRRSVYDYAFDQHAAGRQLAGALLAAEIGCQVPVGTIIGRSACEAGAIRAELTRRSILERRVLDCCIKDIHTRIFAAEAVRYGEQGAREKASWQLCLARSLCATIWSAFAWCHLLEREPAGAGGS